MPNINAALGCAQLEIIENYLESKRNLTKIYSNYFQQKGINFFKEPIGSRSNYWLNTISLETKEIRDQ